MSDIRLTQLDGKLPNLALMRLSAWHRAKGDRTRLMRTPYRRLDEPKYQRVYGSAIFGFSKRAVERLTLEWPDAIVGGTGSGTWQTIEQIEGFTEVGLDYDLYPDFPASIGFTQRGCRLSCPFCVVPQKEGKPKGAATIAEIYRGAPHPKHIHLLDNDFFGGPAWRERIKEIRSGGFKVSFTQGINIRVLTNEIAEAVASIEYRDDGFRSRRLYTAWDNIADEKPFFRGIDRLEAAGVPPQHIMAYMLVGYDEAETWERLFHRFNRMVARGVRPYPMIYGDKKQTLPRGGRDDRIGHKTIGDFQRWANTGLYRACSFEEYSVNAKPALKGQQSLFHLAHAATYTEASA
jgi:hypothetical protein